MIHLVKNVPLYLHNFFFCSTPRASEPALHSHSPILGGKAWKSGGCGDSSFNPEVMPGTLSTPSSNKEREREREKESVE